MRRGEAGADQRQGRCVRRSSSVGLPDRRASAPTVALHAQDNSQESVPEKEVRPQPADVDQRKLLATVVPRVTGFPPGAEKVRQVAVMADQYELPRQGRVLSSGIAITGRSARWMA